MAVVVAKRYRMAARIENGRVQLLTRTGLDWTSKYPSVIAALSNLNVKTAYLDGELCGVDDAGLPSFAQTQAATDGEGDARLVYYAFDILHIAGWDVSNLPLIQRKALLEPLVTNKPGLQTLLRSEVRPSARLSRRSLSARGAGDRSRMWDSGGEANGDSGAPSPLLFEGGKRRGAGASPGRACSTKTSEG
jgi:hypothetical protein